MRVVAWVVVATGAFAAISSTSKVASATDDTPECLQASEDGQRLRDEKKFVDARDAFGRCGRDVCPRVVRKACIQWRDEVGASLSSLVFAARDAAGRDVIDVRVTLDGRPVAEALDGGAIVVDPGPHKVRFVPPRARAVDMDIVVREGEKNRIVSVEVGGDARGSREASAGVSSRQRVGILVGGAGLVALGIGAYFGAQAIRKRSDSDKECPNDDCTARGVLLNDQALTDAWVSDIALGVGILGAAVGTYLLVTSGTSGGASARTATRMRLTPSLAPRAAGVALSCGF